MVTFDRTRYLTAGRAYATMQCRAREVATATSTLRPCRSKRSTNLRPGLTVKTLVFSRVQCESNV
eukprot:scaffold2093_cov161-Amphora_coffeaeformis.AAC.8